MSHGIRTYKKKIIIFLVQLYWLQKMKGPAFAITFLFCPIIYRFKAFIIENKIYIF